MLILQQKQPYGDNVTAALKMIRIRYNFYKQLLGFLTSPTLDIQQAQKLVERHAKHAENLSLDNAGLKTLKRAWHEMQEKISLFEDVEKLVRAAVTDLACNALTRPAHQQLLNSYLIILCANKHRSPFIHALGAYPLKRTTARKLRTGELYGPGFLVLFTANMNNTILDLNQHSRGEVSLEPEIQEWLAHF